MRSTFVILLVLLIFQVEAAALIGPLQIQAANAMTGNAGIEYRCGNVAYKYGVYGYGMINNVNLNNWWSDYIWTHVVAISPGGNSFEVGIDRHLQWPLGYSQQYYYTIIDQGVVTSNFWGSPNNGYHGYQVESLVNQNPYTWRATVDGSVVKEYTFQSLNVAALVLSQLESQSTHVPDTVGKQVSHWQYLEYKTNTNVWWFWTDSTGYDPIPGYPFDNVHQTIVSDYEYYTSITS
ncbi:MAG TPA: hypothetical protein VMS77_06585 [Conexivisphaerales archaeon]|nr:hypothetical protein [Conexivisphaerales archaeon]